MLKESVERLNINVSNSDFRKNASNVIAAMLEARINKQQPQSMTQSPPRPLKKAQQQKQQIPPPPSILKKPQSNQVDPEFLPPPPPIYEDSFNHTTKLNGSRIYDQTDFKDELPLPPPPSILTPPLSSDENDVPQSTTEKSNGIEKVTLRNKKYHHSNNGHNHQSSVAFSDVPSSVLNGGNKFELSSHARDRRSYIEKLDNQLSNIEGDELHVTKIANGLANGQLPVCDKCKCKITR